MEYRSTLFSKVSQWKWWSYFGTFRLIGFSFDTAFIKLCYYNWLAEAWSSTLLGWLITESTHHSIGQAVQNENPKTWWYNSTLETNGEEKTLKSKCVIKCPIINSKAWTESMKRRVPDISGCVSILSNNSNFLSLTHLLHLHLCSLKIHFSPP